MQWNKHLLKDIADVRDGTHDSPKQVSEGFPLVTSRHIKNGKINFLDTYNISEDDFNKINKRSKVDKYDILLSMIGTVGEICIVTTDKKFAIKNVALLKLHDNKLLSQFIYYYLRSPSAKYNLIELTKGTTQQYVSLDDLRHFSLPIPPKSEQKTIVHILGSLDDKIDLLHRQNATLERMAETLFRQWFIEEAQEDWKECTLGDIINLNYGKALKEKDRSGTGFPVVGSSGIVGYHKNFFVEGPGIVIGRKGTLGKVSLIDNHFYPIDTTYYITSNISCLFYVYFLLKTIDFEGLNTDSAVPGLNRDAALQIEIRKHPASLIQRFDAFCIRLFNKKNSNTKQIQTLEKLRDTLLPKLMSGEVRVRVDE